MICMFRINLVSIISIFILLYSIFYVGLFYNFSAKSSKGLCTRIIGMMTIFHAQFLLIWI
jgi:hypothetical protein